MNINYLTFHATCEIPPPDKIHTISEEQFHQHIDKILDDNLMVVDQNSISNTHINKGYGVGITFDDGNSSNFNIAQYLHRKGLSASFFISTSKIGMPGYLTENEIKEMRQLGMLIGSHGNQHECLTELSINRVNDELFISKKILEKILQEPIEHFAFVGGRYNKNIIKIAQGLGYKYLYSTEWGSNNISKQFPIIIRRNTIWQGISNKQFSNFINDKNFLIRYQYVGKEFMRKIIPELLYAKIRKMYIGFIE